MSHATYKRMMESFLDGELANDGWSDSQIECFFNLILTF